MRPSYDKGLEPPGKVIYFIRSDGVQFDPRYADRLVGMLQRLQNEEVVEGLGIGIGFVNLRVIVHRLGGSVWADGRGQGSLHFSLYGPQGRVMDDLGDVFVA
jgi:chemotaxis family two-component system sensor kinase Cph1